MTGEYKDNDRGIACFVMSFDEQDLANWNLLKTEYFNLMKDDLFFKIESKIRLR